MYVNCMLLHHCSNFRAWTSFSSNSWNAQRQGGISSDSNSSQPSWLRPSNPDTWSPSLSALDGISPPVCHSLNPGSQETGPYVKKGSASWCSCCSPGFWKQSACCWQVLHSFWPYCCQERSSLPEQMPSSSTLFIEFSNSGSLMSCRYLKTVKDASFQLLHGQSWKSLAQVSEAVTILVQCLGELLD